MQYLLLLYWIFKAVKANVTRTDDCGKWQSHLSPKLLFGIDKWCGMVFLYVDEELLIIDHHKLIKFCSETNATQVIAEGRFGRIYYSPRDGGKIQVLEFESSFPNKLVTFVQNSSTNAKWTPHTVMELRSQPPPCDDELSGIFMIFSCQFFGFFDFHSLMQSVVSL